MSNQVLWTSTIPANPTIFHERLSMETPFFQKWIAAPRSLSYYFCALMQLGRIIIFPIKSLDGVSLESAVITAGGILENDRIYAIYDTEGKVVNGKRTAKIHEMRCAFDGAIREIRLWTNADTAQQQFQLDNPGSW
jgi:hypothetical protein